MFEENGLAAGSTSLIGNEQTVSREQRETVSDRVTLAQAFGQLAETPPAAVTQGRADIADLDKAIVIKVEGVKVLRLPAGTSLEDVKVVDDDVVLVQKNGAPPIVLDGGARYLPDIIVGDVEIPREILNAALQKAGIEPAAGPETSESAGGNFSQPAGDIGPFLGISPLLPPTELAFPALDRREIAPASSALAEAAPPTVTILSGRSGDQLLVKEDGSATFIYRAAAAAGDGGGGQRRRADGGDGQRPERVGRRAHEDGEPDCRSSMRPRDRA